MAALTTTSRHRLTDAQRRQRAINERDFQATVIRHARSLGWGVTQSAAKEMATQANQYGVPVPPLDGLIYHPRYSLGSEPGWPDLVLVRRRDRRLIFAEIKAEKGVLKARQAEVLDLLRQFEQEPDGLVRGEAIRPNPSESHMRVLGTLPRIAVRVWRPSMLDEIIEELR